MGTAQEYLLPRSAATHLNARLYLFVYHRTASLIPLMKLSDWRRLQKGHWVRKNLISDDGVQICSLFSNFHIFRLIGIQAQSLRRFS